MSLRVFELTSLISFFSRKRENLGSIRRAMLAECPFLSKEAVHFSKASVCSLIGHQHMPHWEFILSECLPFIFHHSFTIARKSVVDSDAQCCLSFSVFPLSPHI